MSKPKHIIIIIAILLATCLMGISLLGIAQGGEIVADGATDQSFTFFVTGAVSGDPCMTASDTNWNVKYYVQGAAARDMNNATVGALNSHTDNSVKIIGDGIYQADFPDTCFDGGIGTSVTLWLSHDSNEFFCPPLEVMLTPPVNADAIDGDTGAAETMEVYYDDDTAATAEHGFWFNSTTTDNFTNMYNGTKVGLGTVFSNPLAASDIVDEWETQSQADPNGFQVSVRNWSGTALAAPDTAGYPKVTIKSGNGTGEITTSGGAVSVVSAVAGTVGSVTGSVGGNVIGSVGSVLADVNVSAESATVYLVDTTVAEGNSVTQFILTAGSPNDLEYVNHTITVIDADDPNRSSERRITDYDGATKQVTVGRDLTFTPAAGDIARIPEGGYSTGSFGFGSLIETEIFRPRYGEFLAAASRRRYGSGRAPGL